MAGVDSPDDPRPLALGFHAVEGDLVLEGVHRAPEAIVLARMHLAGLGVPASKPIAQDLLRVSASRNYKPAMCTLAFLLDRTGAHAEQDEARALRKRAQNADAGRACAEREVLDEAR